MEKIQKLSFGWSHEIGVFGCCNTFLGSSHFEPTHGTLKYHVESGTFTQVDNIYYDTDSGGHNTGPIALPFNFSAHVVGYDVVPQYNRAYVKVSISAAHNTVGGDLTTQASYVTDFGEDLGGNNGGVVTHTYLAGIDILQTTFTSTWSPGL